VLLKEIAIAQEIVASKNAISILSHIHLEAENNTLSIKSTDLKVHFETRVPVVVIEPGAASVIGDKFLGILNSIPDGELEFEQSEGKTTIRPTARKIHFQLKSAASDEYPDFPVPAEEGFFTLPVRDFKQMIAQTVFAVSDDETRYYMNGVLFEKQDGKLVMVGTDGRRLAYIENVLGDAIQDFAGVIVPPKILNLIMRRAGDEGELAIAVTERTIFIRFGSYNLSSVIIEGTFPSYQRVIPESQSFVFTVNRFEMLDALRRVSILAEQKSHRMFVKIASGVLSVYTEESDIGTAKEEIPARYEGEEVSIALNYRYIEEPFKVMSANEISMHFTDPMKALTIKPAVSETAEDADEEAVPESAITFFHIVMPMNL
jgi:DNA polymerase-3 subunit beta